MIRRILPHPVLSLVVALVWLLLVNRFAWGSLVFALILGLWQMAGASVCPAGASVAVPNALQFSYPDDLDRALRALWQGAMGATQDAAARNAR